MTGPCCSGAGRIARSTTVTLGWRGEPQDAARVRVDRAGFRQRHDMQQQITPGTSGLQPQAEATIRC
jgi:hypothetical protein